jgi:hypothetical protein
VKKDGTGHQQRRREQQRRTAREVAAAYAAGPKKVLYQVRITFAPGRRHG